MIFNISKAIIDHFETRNQSTVTVVLLKHHCITVHYYPDKVRYLAEVYDAANVYSYCESKDLNDMLYAVKDYLNTDLINELLRNLISPALLSELEITYTIDLEHK